MPKKQGYDHTQKGLSVDNLPTPNKGKLTGQYKIDLYGCWWEVKREDKTTFWMIGEYSESFYKEWKKRGGQG